MEVLVRKLLPTHDVGIVSGETGMETRGGVAGIAFRIASGVSRNGVGKWVFQSDATSSKIVPAHDAKILQLQSPCVKLEEEE